MKQYMYKTCETVFDEQGNIITPIKTQNVWIDVLRIQYNDTCESRYGYQMGWTNYGKFHSDIFIDISSKKAQILFKK